MGNIFKKSTSDCSMLKNFISIILFLFILIPSVYAHKFHTSLTVMNYNSDEKTVEITVQLFTDDLVRVLETKHGKRIDLEKTETDKLILDYLSENLILNDSNGNILKQIWIGKEIEVDKLFVYVEIPFEGSLEGNQMKNTIFFETFEEQTNLVICKFIQKKADLLFKVGDKFKAIQGGSSLDE